MCTHAHCGDGKVTRQWNDFCFLFHAASRPGFSRSTYQRRRVRETIINSHTHSGHRLPIYLTTMNLFTNLSLFRIIFFRVYHINTRYKPFVVVMFFSVRRTVQPLIFSNNEDNFEFLHIINNFICIHIHFQEKYGFYSRLCEICHLSAVSRIENWKCTWEREKLVSKTLSNIEIKIQLK